MKRDGDLRFFIANLGIKDKKRTEKRQKKDKKRTKKDKKRTEKDRKRQKKSRTAICSMLVKEIGIYRLE